MALFIKSLHLQKNALANITRQRTRVFSSIRLLDINVINDMKLTQRNSVMKTFFQQRFYTANSLLSRESTDTPSLREERESASLISDNKNAGFVPTSEFTSTSLTDNQTEQTSQLQVNDKFEQDWSKSFFGLSTKAFPQNTIDILLAPIEVDDIEIKPDGMIYLPEIKYRRILNKSFGPGGWGLAPRGENSVSPRTISREYALVCHGRLVSVSRGEQEYFDPSGLATAAEGAKSNALMRCCKDLGIASELWDPTFIREFRKQYCNEMFVEHVNSKKRKKIWVRKDHGVEYPYTVLS